MIYSKEPANTYYVYLTAYRDHYTPAVNEVFVDGLAKRLRGHPELYGEILDEGVVRCYTGQGYTGATIDRALKVHCTSPDQVRRLAEWANARYDQESILVVASQTHTASMVAVRTLGEYPQNYEELETVPLGVFTQRNTGAGSYYTIDGKRWEIT